ncbi:hypothetical protein [Ancylobacter polymorphus]|uniref:ABC transporter permease n=1 Tax=Ancylobacter polymorphus TaxID=223390 RepID=A0ABU0B5K9_9HYPH|nr:hypothetical protein [Ancylobacter polymorphus]MDQ0301111.1 hypothetical protein [Ancylobacter polymorphus]
MTPALLYRGTAPFPKGIRARALDDRPFRPDLRRRPVGRLRLIAFRVRQLVPAAPAIVLLAVIAALAAVRFGLFDAFTPRQSYAM